MRTVRPLSLVILWGWSVFPLSAQSSQLVCPIVLDGHAGGYRATTRLTIINVGTATLSTTVKAFKNDGTPAELFAAQSETAVELKQNESTTIATHGESAVLQDGWLMVSYQTATKPVLAADLHILKEGETCSRESVFRVPLVEAGSRFSSLGRRTENWELGYARVLAESAFAVVNPSNTQTARVRLSLSQYPVGQGPGAIWGLPDAVIDIPPRSRVAKFLTELFPWVIPAGTLLPRPIINSSGTVSIVSDSPVACGAVDLDLRTATYSQGVLSAVGSPQSGQGETVRQVPGARLTDVPADRP